MTSVGPWPMIRMSVKTGIYGAREMAQRICMPSTHIKARASAILVTQEVETGVDWLARHAESASSGFGERPCLSEVDSDQHAQHDPHTHTCAHARANTCTYLYPKM